MATKPVVRDGVTVVATAWGTTRPCLGLTTTLKSTGRNEQSALMAHAPGISTTEPPGRTVTRLPTVCAAAGMAIRLQASDAIKKPTLRFDDMLRLPIEW